MKIHDLANKQFESIDEITTDIAESIIEVDEVVKEKERLEKEKEDLQESVNSLKAKIWSFWQWYQSLLTIHEKMNQKQRKK